MNRIELINLWNQSFPLGIGVEVGTFKGEYSKEILQRWNGTLFMVDVWDDLGKEYVDSSNHKNFINGVYGECMNNIKGFEDRGIMVRAKSSIASTFFEDNSLDFIYIDANHSYDYVKEDLSLWFPKLKKGGWFMGHDYLKLNWSVPPFCDNGIDKHIWMNSSDGVSPMTYAGIFGVNPAVDEFCKENKYEPQFTDEWFGTWYFVK